MTMGHIRHLNISPNNLLLDDLFFIQLSIIPVSESFLLSAIYFSDTLLLTRAKGKRTELVVTRIFPNCLF